MVKLTMLTGEEMEFSITMGSLNRIKDSYPEYTAKYFEAAAGANVETTEDAFWRAADMLYVGYLCRTAKDGNMDSVLGYQEFLDILPEDMNLVLYASAALLNPNRTGDFEKYLKSIQKSAPKTR